MSLSITGAADWQSQSAATLQNNWQNVLGAAAKALGLSPAAVSAQLQSGSSLSQIARAQGVSQDTLTSAIAAALSPSTQASASPSQLNKIATSIANRAGGPHAGHRHHQAGADDDDQSEITSVDVLVVLTGAYSYGADATQSEAVAAPAVNELA